MDENNIEAGYKKITYPCVKYLKKRGGGGPGLGLSPDSTSCLGGTRLCPGATGAVATYMWVFHEGGLASAGTLGTGGGALTSEYIQVQ